MITYGFSSKHNLFTIWNLTITYEPLDHYRRYKVFNYKYMGKTDEPKSDLDENIEGRLRSFTKRVIDYTDDVTFRFGRYNGKKIEEVKDLKYTKWYFEQIEGTHKAFVKDYLYNNWYDFRVNENGHEYAVSPETIKKEKEAKKRQNSLINRVHNGRTVNLFITTHPRYDGRIRIDGADYYFPKVVGRWYQGFEYYLPVLNGKAKRIKNHTIEAALFEMDNKVYISNFKVVK